MQVTRQALLEQIQAAAGRRPVTVLTGPRQAGKATLARELLAEDSPKAVPLTTLAEPGQLFGAAKS
jgi:predicted AAA+ superfamily ATPase